MTADIFALDHAVKSADENIIKPEKENQIQNHKFFCCNMLYSLAVPVKSRTKDKNA